jgi:Protein of unknown function (DUF3631)
MSNAFELLARFGINSVSTIGRHYTTCPKCSAGRKPAHQKLLVLGVTITAEGIGFGCNHCDFKGGAFYKPNGHDPFVAEYSYVDESSKLLFQVCRKLDTGFVQRSPNGHPNGWVYSTNGVRKVPFHLPNLIRAVAGNQLVVIAEGEKDVLSLERSGYAATTNAGGAGKWRAEYNEHFRGADVVIMPDFDEVGLEHGNDIAAKLIGIARRVRVLVLGKEGDRSGYDVSNWLADGGTREQLDALIAGAKDWQPPGAKAPDAEKKADPPLFEHWDTEPADEPTNGTALVQALTERIQRHVIITKNQATVVALWILLTWVHEPAAVHSPILLATSPEANSGKTTLLNLVGYLVRNSLCSVSISGPALFRSIEKWQPTFVIDEADTVVASDEDLKAVINSGWTRGQSVIRCDPKTNDPRTYTTFCPKALGMKGRKLPDTTLTRAIIIEMQRKRPHEQVADFDHIDDGELAELRARCARWAQDNAERVKEWEPEIPEGFHNRTRANWKTMFAIAEVCGWQSKAAQAARAIEKVKDAFESSIGTQLLSDLRDMFPEGVEDMFSRDIVAKLTADAEKPWLEYSRGKPLSQKQLANLLSGFGVCSEDVHQGAEHLKGYKRVRLLPLFDRYLSAPPQETSSDPCNRADDCSTGTSGEIRSVRETDPHGSENANLSYSRSDLHACTDRTPPNGGGVSDHGNTGAPDPDDWSYQFDDYPELPADIDRSAR